MRLARLFRALGSDPPTGSLDELDELLAPAATKDGFVSADEMTAEQWQQAIHGGDRPRKRPPLFGSAPDPSSFPWPH